MLSFSRTILQFSLLAPLVKALPAKIELPSTHKPLSTIPPELHPTPTSTPTWTEIPLSSMTPKPMNMPRQMFIPKPLEHPFSRTTKAQDKPTFPAPTNPPKLQKRVWDPELAPPMRFHTDPYIPPQTKYDDYFMNVASAYLDKMDQLLTAMSDPVLWGQLKVDIANGKVNPAGALYSRLPAATTASHVHAPTRLGIELTEAPPSPAETVTIEKIQRRAQPQRESLNPWVFKPGPWSRQEDLDFTGEEFVIGGTGEKGPVYHGFPNSGLEDKVQEGDSDQELTETVVNWDAIRAENEQRKDKENEQRKDKGNEKGRS